MAIKKNSPIGVFDSGLGGLTVVKALKKVLPYEDIVYFGDNARVPYGTKSPESIIRFSKQNAAILNEYNVKMIVIACNSSSSYALPILRKTNSVPVVSVVEPGVKKAVLVTRNKRIGVIATPATVLSEVYAKKIKQQDRSIRVFSQACPLFVPLVEEGWFTHKVTVQIVREYLKSLTKAKVDTVILGCTHYPLLRKTIQLVLGPRVRLIDSAQEVALEVSDVLGARREARTRSHKGQARFLCSDSARHFLFSARKFLGYDIKSVKRIKFS